ncbi:calcium-binding protein [filamentous cyanobacterium LEGE 11480]|uniref:Calcium-binding protein n=1 Tax=Romeriopsis navalis LEGE 11480 TaxID=2777977 RepID=A0A928Z2F5_9CYAN|nr:4Fe-4S binding protein [Romeriopsis navalis]MBE9030331.1 calcium-binding protein [Romeriopsis navalis LEGE 11480]
MLNNFSERHLYRIRWILLASWLLLILCLFNDTVSFWLTHPSNQYSPWRMASGDCVPMQNGCLGSHQYHVAMPIFWNYVVPGSILVLLVCGHEVWRRVCPLAFISQLPSAIGWQRQTKSSPDKKSSRGKIAPQSWLGRNYLYLQFALLYVGLCARLLLMNAEAIALGIWLIGTMIAALVVGYLYVGKSWCQYFCPMAPVQKVFSQPTGIFTSKAHTESPHLTPQSMCRVAEPTGVDIPACVGCQRVCMDIDAEKNYWESINQPAYRLLYYGYVGLVLGFFTYYYLYAGNWEYFFSGIWARQVGQLAELTHPGFYLNDHAMPLPKWMAVPLYLALSVALTYMLGLVSEWLYFRLARYVNRAWTKTHLRHHLYSGWTFVAFNLFFVFVGKSWGRGLPIWGQRSITLGLVLISVIWLYRMTRRSPERYSREQLTHRFLQQLAKRDLVLPRSWQQRCVAQLSLQEILILIQAIPGYKAAQGKEIYQQMLDEIFAEMDGAITARIKLAQMRTLRKTLLAIMATQIQMPPAADEHVLEKPESQSRKRLYQRIPKTTGPPFDAKSMAPYNRGISPPEVWQE